jgi:hypothetical protein
MPKESVFQTKLIKEIQNRFRKVIILKNDTKYIQGIPDLTILYENRWAVLECKRNEYESKQPNQDYYVNLLNDMGFSRFVYPENEEEVLYDLEEYFYFS